MAVVYSALKHDCGTRMKRIYVRSSSISHVGYDRRTRTLEVEFRNGRAYQYLGVPPQIYHELMQADSKGRFINFIIKKHYPYLRV